MFSQNLHEIFFSREDGGEEETNDCDKKASEHQQRKVPIIKILIRNTRSERLHKTNKKKQDGATASLGANTNECVCLQRIYVYWTKCLKEVSKKRESMQQSHAVVYKERKKKQNKLKIKLLTQVRTQRADEIWY